MSEIRPSAGLRSLTEVDARGARAVTAAVVVALLPLGLALTLAIVTGALAIPHNDAWSHALIADTFARTGEFRLVGWNRSALIGLVVIAIPVGTTIVGQQLLVVGLAAVALVASLLFLRPRIGTAAALVAVLAIGFTPEFGLLGTSFMTDVPMFVGLMVAAVLTDVGLRRQRLWPFASALVVGAWAATVRDQGIAGVMAVLAVAVVALRSDLRRKVLTIGAAITVAWVLFQFWRRRLPMSDRPELSWDPLAAWSDPQVLILTTALYLLPVVLMVARPGCWKTRSWLWAAGVGLVALGSVGGDLRRLVHGNYLTIYGAYPTAAGLPPQVLPTWLPAVLGALALLSLVLMAGHVSAAGVPREPVTWSFLLTLLVTTVGPSLLGQDLFARAAVPLLPFVAAVIAGTRGPQRRVWGVVGLIPLLVVSLLLWTSTMTRDVARWSFAESLSQMTGETEQSVDAGLEWNGTHNPPEIAVFRTGIVQHCLDEPSDSFIRIVSAGRSDPEDPIVGTWSYRPFLWAGSERLVAVRLPCEPVEGRT